MVERQVSGFWIYFEATPTRIADKLGHGGEKKSRMTPKFLA